MGGTHEILKPAYGLVPVIASEQETTVTLGVVSGTVSRMRDRFRSLPRALICLRETQT